MPRFPFFPLCIPIAFLLLRKMSPFSPFPQQSWSIVSSAAAGSGAERGAAFEVARDSACCSRHYTRHASGAAWTHSRATLDQLQGRPYCSAPLPSRKLALDSAGAHADGPAFSPPSHAIPWSATTTEEEERTDGAARVRDRSSLDGGVVCVCSRCVFSREINGCHSTPEVMHKAARPQ